MKLNEVGRQTLQEKVYQELMLSIISGEIQPGTKLNEVNVAKQLNVSPTPVREAFRKLASDGFIEIIPYCGVIVKDIDDEEIREAYECRRVLETLGLKLAIANLTKENIEDLYRIIDEYKIVTCPKEIFEISTSFHNYILDISRNKILMKLMDSINKIILRDRNISSVNENRVNNIYMEHKKIVDAMAEGDNEKAISAMLQHIDNGLSYVNEFKEKNV